MVLTPRWRAFALAARGLSVAPWCLLVLVWYGVAYGGFVNPALVPAPLAVALRAWQLLVEGRLADLEQRSQLLPLDERFAANAHGHRAIDALEVRLERA